MDDALLGWAGQIVLFDAAAELANHPAPAEISITAEVTCPHQCDVRFLRHGFVAGIRSTVQRDIKWQKIVMMDADPNGSSVCCFVNGSVSNNGWHFTACDDEVDFNRYWNSRRFR